MTLWNHENFRVHDVTIRNVTVVSPLIASVKKWAAARFHIYNSANLGISAEFEIGYLTQMISGDQSYGGEDTNINSNVYSRTS